MYFKSIKLLCEFAKKGELSTQEKIFVSVPASVKYSAESDTALVKIMHSGLNKNGSYITQSALENAVETIANRPLLAYIHKVKENYEFGGHAIREEEDGELAYDEIPVGVFHESGERIISEEDGKSYIFAGAKLYKEYSKAVDILKRHNGQSPVSAEILINKFSYDASTEIITIADFSMQGCTILGYEEDGTPIEPGMYGAEIKLSNAEEEYSKKKTFSLLYAKSTWEKFDYLNKLIYKTYELYLEDVYEDYVIGYKNSEFFRICYEYNKDEDKYHLTGDPVKVIREWLTEEERQNALRVAEELSEIKETLFATKETLFSLKKQSDKAQKETILNSAEYSEIKDRVGFQALFTKLDTMTKEEIESTADKELLAHYKEIAQKSNATPAIFFAPPITKSNESKYGGAEEFTLK